MYDKIIVAIDRSPSSKQVFAKALSLAKADGATLILLHVLSVEEETSPFMAAYLCDRVTEAKSQRKDRCLHVPAKVWQQANEIYQKEWSSFKEQGLELLRFYTKKAISAGLKTEFTQITGHPSSTICDFARSCNADLIIVGRRGHSGLQEMLLGSVSNYVVHHAPCSVLLVQTPITEELSSTEEVDHMAFVR